MISKMVKRERYADLMTNLKSALENEYYYEAIFIEYAIIEDRTESLLKHAGLPYKDENDKNIKLNIKLNSIKYNLVFKDELIKSCISLDLINSLHDWKNKRNTFIHDLIESSYDNENIKELARLGIELVKELNYKSTLVTKYLDKVSSV